MPLRIVRGIGGVVGFPTNSATPLLKSPTEVEQRA
jgi:hypothetical protein